MNEQDPHRASWDLIPWVVNGTASAAERRAVEAHCQACADCRHEFEFQRQLQAGLALDTAPADEQVQAVEAGLRSFWAQPEVASAPPPPTSLPAANGRWQRTLVAAVVLQAVGLAAALGVIWDRQRPADYQVLSQPAATSPARIRLVPAPGLQIGELRALLARSDLQLVQTSADAGHLGLALAPGARFTPPQAVLRLRAEPGVLLAELIAPP